MANNEANSTEEGATISTAVAIDRDKNSQNAVRWAVENLRLKEKIIILVHVSTKQISQPQDFEGRLPTHSENRQLFLPYRGFCARKGVRTKEVILHNIDVVVALSEFISAKSIKNIVLGASRRSALTRAFRNADVATCVGKFAPDFCSVYAVSKGKTQKIKCCAEVSPNSPDNTAFSTAINAFSSDMSAGEGSMRSISSNLSSSDSNVCEQTIPTEMAISSSAPSPLCSMNSNESMHLFAWGKRLRNTNPTPPESVSTSFESSTSSICCNSLDNLLTGDGKLSSVQQSVNYLNISDGSSENWPHYLMELSDHSEVQSYGSDISYEPLDEPRISNSSRYSSASVAAEMEDELRRMKLELMQITEKYNAACLEAVIAREKVRDIVDWSKKESSKMEESKQTQVAALAIVERERQKCRAAIGVAQKAQITAELELEKRKHAEWKLKIESKEKLHVLGALARGLVPYRRYSIGEIEAATNHFSDSDKIGEGSYGPVYRATIDHTAVAIKVLRSNFSDGLKQFQQEVEVLSRMRHPSMVILLGACPDNGCLVYEYMENGCLEDRLFRKGGTLPLPWPTRFAIASEIGTALNFLHQMQPQPLVHRDLKPANILLDKNYISKIGDVGLSRLVPPSVADNITQYHMTAAAGTFCYIDPEYQQTGLLGTKSDIYSFGIILLQLFTARPPMGLTHRVKKAIEMGRFEQILDQTVKDWAVEEALCFAKLALKCSELRRRDRPSLDSVILPELVRLREVGSKSEAGRRLYRCAYSEGPSFEENSSSSPQVFTELFKHGQADLPQLNRRGPVN